MSDFGKMSIDLTRKRFDEITNGLLDKTLELTRDVVTDARERHNVTSVDEVLLVGGSTFMPQVEAGLRASLADIGLGHALIKRVDPHLAVAKGAAWYAYKCAIDAEVRQNVAEATGQEAMAIRIENVAASVRGEAERHVAVERGISLSDVRKMTRQRIINAAPKTFGIEVVAGQDNEKREIANLILKDTNVPCEASREFYTASANQSGVSILCWESISLNDNCDLNEGERIGDDLNLEFGEPLQKNTPIDVHFKLSADALLSVTATERSKGKVIEGKFRVGAIGSDEELQERKAVTSAMTIT